MFKDKDSFKQAYVEKFAESEGKTFDEGTAWDYYHTLVLLLKEKISLYWAETNRAYSREGKKQVYYFSMEFLIGKLLSYYLANLGIKELVQEGLAELGLDLEDLVAQENDAGLGNGGLGRLAACFLDSMAFQGIPGHGNGIRYKYGLFQQKIVNGFQAEVPDNWLKNGYPWEIRKPDKSVVVRFKGNVRVEQVNGKLSFNHENYEPVLAVPYDIPVVSYQNIKNINNLRLWSAEPMLEEFDLHSFNRGDFSEAVSYKSEVEAISYILYPDDSSQAGRELRLKQEYFFVAAGLTAIVRRYKKNNHSLKELASRVAVHINDTHPALCIPELMRILMDEEGMGWDEAWDVTVNTVSYTNHTIMPEALEKWPVDLFKYLLPRIYMIVEEIDRRFRDEMSRRYPGRSEVINKTAIIRDGYIWMANLAVVGSNSINGVSKLHTEIIKKYVLKDFYGIFPNRFNNKTNGVSHRRFLLEANPALARLITRAIGSKWVEDPEKLEQLLGYREDTNFLEELARVKYSNKCRLAEYIREKQGIMVDPSSIFDVQVKRIHAYKRQLLNVFKIMDLYNRLKENPNLSLNPHTYIFGGKAAPGYHYAKTVIKLINTLAQKINPDHEVNGKIRVVFLENFNVSLAEMIYPAAEVSEQISTASREASGTGNMKFMMNGAITLGTLDGANIEIREAVGDENIVIFGQTADKVMKCYQDGGYRSWDEYHAYPRLKKVVDQLINGFFIEAAGEFRIIYDSLLKYNDEFFVLKDFCSYTDACSVIHNLYLNRLNWNKMALINIAKSGAFSSDRTVQEYARDIWLKKGGGFDA
ncbi:MAG: glycogen/starch/alpha-glucan phosphorylase [Bacillota bacterium]